MNYYYVVVFLVGWIIGTLWPIISLAYLSQFFDQSCPWHTYHSSLINHVLGTLITVLWSIMSLTHLSQFFDQSCPWHTYHSSLTNHVLGTLITVIWPIMSLTHLSQFLTNHVTNSTWVRLGFCLCLWYTTSYLNHFFSPPSSLSLRLSLASSFSLSLSLSLSLSFSLSPPSLYQIPCTPLQDIRTIKKANIPGKFVVFRNIRYIALVRLSTSSSFNYIRVNILNALETLVSVWILFCLLCLCMMYASMETR